MGSPHNIERPCAYCCVCPQGLSHLSQAFHTVSQIQVCQVWAKFPAQLHWKKKTKDLKLTQNFPVFYVSLCVEKRVPVVCMHFCYLQSRVSSILLIIITWFGHYSCHNRLFRLPNLAVCFSISTLYIWYSDSISEEYALSVRLRSCLPTQKPFTEIF